MISSQDPGSNPRMMDDPQAVRLDRFRRALLRSTTYFSANHLASDVFEWDRRPFGTSAAIATRFRFVRPEELRVTLTQFCNDFGIHDPESIAILEKNQVFHSNLAEFRVKRAQFFASHPARDALGQEAAAFMGAQALTLLFGFSSAVMGKPITVPLVDLTMRKGAHGLYTVGRAQFDELAQITVDLCAWLLRSGRTAIVLIEAPLGNSVPVAVFARVAKAHGVKVDIVEWGCPRNDRALNGRTVTESAADLASDPTVASAPFLLFLDDAITGSRFLKMATALRKAVGASRFGAIAMRARFNPLAGYPVGQIRDLRTVRSWAASLGMPFGEVTLPDLPLFRIDGRKPGLLATALAWGDAGHSAGKRKTNLLFLFIDRFEAITNELGTPGASRARRILLLQVWRQDTFGRHFITPPEIAEALSVRLVAALPTDFFDQIRSAAKLAFPHDYFGRAVLGEAELRQRTDWLYRCIVNAARAHMSASEADWLNRAVNDLSHAGFNAGIDNPPRDHDYGLYTLSLPPGEDRLHRELVDLIVANAALRSPRP